MIAKNRPYLRRKLILRCLCCHFRFRVIVHVVQQHQPVGGLLTAFDASFEIAVSFQKSSLKTTLSLKTSNGIGSRSTLANRIRESRSALQKKEETFCNFEGGEGSQCCQLWENYEENVESVLFLLKHQVFGLLDLVPKDGAVLKSVIITFRSI